MDQRIISKSPECVASKILHLVKELCDAPGLTWGVSMLEVNNIQYPVNPLYLFEGSSPRFVSESGMKSQVPESLL